MRRSSRQDSSLGLGDESGNLSAQSCILELSTKSRVTQISSRNSAPNFMFCRHFRLSRYFGYDFSSWKCPDSSAAYLFVYSSNDLLLTSIRTLSFSNFGAPCSGSKCQAFFSGLLIRSSRNGSGAGRFKFLEAMMRAM